MADRGDEGARRALEDVLPLQRLLLAGCASVAVVYLPVIVTQLRGLLPGLEITILLTPEAAGMTDARTLAVFSKGPVLSQWDEAPEGTVPHIELTDWADLLLVLPATANVLAKAASGIADDLVTTSVLAATCPVVFVPSMNPRIWAKPAVRRAVAQLREDGAHVLDPVEGIQSATGEPGVGAMPPIRELLVHLARALSPEDAR